MASRVVDRAAVSLQRSVTDELWLIDYSKAFHAALVPAMVDAFYGAHARWDTDAVAQMVRDADADMYNATVRRRMVHPQAQESSPAANERATVSPDSDNATCMDDVYSARLRQLNVDADAVPDLSCMVQVSLQARTTQEHQ